MISEIARNYVDICSINNFIRLTKEKIELQKERLFLFKDKKNEGLDSQIETEQEIATLQSDEENLLVYLTLIKEKIYKLAVLLGKQPEEISQKFANSDQILEGKNKVEIGLPSTLLRRRPDIREAERNLAKATAKIGSAIADYFPRFSLTGGGILSLVKSISFLIQIVLPGL